MTPRVWGRYRPRTDRLLDYRAGDAAHGYGALLVGDFCAQCAQQGGYVPSHHGLLVNERPIFGNQAIWVPLDAVERCVWPSTKR